MAENEESKPVMTHTEADIAKAVDSGPAEKTNIVANASRAYGYNYASLADIAKAGIDIPQMRIKPTDHGEYIEYLDDNSEWQIGARIVIPEMKGSNAAQAYGSALTYARRYTVQMAKGIACDDDKQLEKQLPSSSQSAVRQSNQDRNQRSKIDFNLLSQVRANLQKCRSVAALAKYQSDLNLDTSHWNILKRDFSRRKDELLAQTPEAEVADGAN